MQYKCSVCGYIYDEAAEKMSFDALPSDWRCPLCGAPKSAFEPMGGEEKAPETPKDTPVFRGDMKKLSAGQLAALFSNLARGSEKQYKAKEAGLFTEIADYFTAASQKEEEASPEALAALLKEDIASLYPAAKSVSAGHGDRGAQRICVWGEKVTRMLSALVERYLQEGEAMLRDTEIWVCTVCGFVYIGDRAPDLCPVCKVPAWKFEKTERRDGV